MIDPNKCQVCFPIVAKIMEIKFEGEKTSTKCSLRAWKECEEMAVEHTEDFVDPAKETTKFVHHRCAKHVEEARLLHEAILKAEQDKK